MYSSRASPCGRRVGHRAGDRRGRGVRQHLDVAGAVVLLHLAGARCADAEHAVGVGERPAERASETRVDAVAEALELGLADVHLEHDRRRSALHEHRADRLAVHAAADRRVQVDDAVAGTQAEAGERAQRLREDEQSLLHGPALVRRDHLEVVQLGERRLHEAGDDRGHAAAVTGVGPEVRHADASSCRGVSLGDVSHVGAGGVGAERRHALPSRGPTSPVDRRMPALAIAIVSYNTSALLDECLRSLKADADAGRAEVWVVDNLRPTTRRTWSRRAPLGDAHPLRREPRLRPGGERRRRPHRRRGGSRRANCDLSSRRARSRRCWARAPRTPRRPRSRRGSSCPTAPPSSPCSRSRR